MMWKWILDIFEMLFQRYNNLTLDEELKSKGDCVEEAYGEAYYVWERDSASKWCNWFQDLNPSPNIEGKVILDLGCGYGGKTTYGPGYWH